MAKCYLCQAETELFRCGIPICIKCEQQTEAAKPKPVGEGGKQQQGGKAAA